jgi:hypothetical protein
MRDKVSEVPISIESPFSHTVQKQQRSRQLNEGTFESRIHQGIDRGRTVEEQGELFGTQNIFKFDPQGFVPGRVSQHDDNFIDGSWKGSAKPKTSSSRT